jgi:HAD superfamily hydrolase (TIGR01509 family)
VIATYFFDIDGTLLDSAPDICAATRQACREIGRLAPSDPDVRRYIGRPLADTFAGLYPGILQAEIDELSRLYTDCYRARAHVRTRVFPGVSETLAALPGRKSTATTKKSATAAAVLEQFGLRRYFDHVQGSDNGRYKPDPAILLEAIHVLHVQPEECLMVGDAPADIEAGKRARMKTCAVAWGYGDATELRRLAPDLWVERPEELLAAVRL